MALARFAASTGLSGIQPATRPAMNLRRRRDDYGGGGIPMLEGLITAAFLIVF